MAHFQNQYGAIPVVSPDPIQKEMDAVGDTTGIGGTEQVAVADNHVGGIEQVDVGGPATIETTTDKPVMTTGGDTLAGGEKDHDHQQKKGIMEKIKEKLPGKHNHDHN